MKQSLRNKIIFGCALATVYFNGLTYGYSKSTDYYLKSNQASYRRDFEQADQLEQKAE